MNIAGYIDHTNLKAAAGRENIGKLCREAREQGFYAVCVNGCYVEQAVKELEDSDVKVASVIGFPLGAMSKEAKVFEAADAVKNGADEIDMVLNIGFLKDGRDKEVEEEIRAVKEAVGSKVLKVIIETCYLDEGEKRRACRLCLAAGADFVKTSTGFGTGGATEEDLRLMKEEVGDKAQIKAAGGVRDVETAFRFIEIGASRLGTSSGVSLVSSGTAKAGEY